MSIFNIVTSVSYQTGARAGQQLAARRQAAHRARLVDRLCHREATAAVAAEPPGMPQSAYDGAYRRADEQTEQWCRDWSVAEIEAEMARPALAEQAS